MDRLSAYNNERHLKQMILFIANKIIVEEIVQIKCMLEVFENGNEAAAVVEIEYEQIIEILNEI